MIKNVLITISIIMNGTLIMYMTGVMPFLLFLSTITIISLSWYIRQLLRKIQTIDSDMDGLFTNLDEFQGHLVSINELEMFYGDETLQSLLGHTHDLVEQFEEFQFKYSSDDVFGDYVIEDEEEIEYDDQPDQTSPSQEIG